MVEAATEFRKNGFNDSDAAILAKTATVFQNVSDEAISAGDSASFIISQMIAFGIEAKDAQSIIDKVNQTSNEFSVSSGDLAQALGIVASTSSAMGNSLDETLGMVVAMTEQTRSASKSARGLNTISSRLSQVLDDTSDTGKKLVAIYDDLGISLEDSSGQMRSTYDILSDLHDVWGTLDTDTQKYIALTSSGTNQLNNFLALMNNFDHATEATKTSLNSAGSAMRENEAYQQSLEYQTQELKAEFQDLANNVIDKQLITSVLGLGEAFLKLANTGVGQLVTKIGLLAGTAWGLSNLLKVSKLLPIIIAQFANFGSVLTGIGNPAVASAIGGIGARIASLGGFSAIALPSLLAVSAAIVGIVEAAKYFSTIDERKLESLSSSLQETQDKISEMTTTGSEYDTLIQNAGKLTDVEKERLGVLQAQLDTLKAQEVEQENAYLTEWQRQQTKTRTDVTVEQRTRDDGSVYYATTGTIEYTEAGRESDKLFEAVYQLNREKQLARTTDAEYLAGLQNILDAHKETYDNLVKLREEYAKTGDETIKLSSEQESFLQIYEHQSEVVGQLGNQYADMSNDIGAFGAAAEESASKLDTYIAALDQYRGANENAADASGVLVNSLFDTNGQLTEAAKQALSTSGSMASMAQSFIQAQQAQSQADFSALILAIGKVGEAAMVTTSQLASMMAMAGVDISGGETSAVASLRHQYYLETGKGSTSGSKMVGGKVEMQNTKEFTDWAASYIQKQAQEKFEAQQKEYTDKLKQISVFTPSGGGGGGGGGGSSSTKKDQEEVKAQTINTVEELRDYLTDESTRLKLIDPDISKSDLQSTLSEVATIYQSYQDYLSQLKQQGFDETSEQYQQAEAEFSQFLAVLEELFNKIAQKGNFTIEELYQKFQEAIGGAGEAVDNLSSKLGNANSQLESSISSLTKMIKEGKELSTLHLGAFTSTGNRVELSEAYKSGGISAEEIVSGYEALQEVWQAMRERDSSKFDEAYQAAMANAGSEGEVAAEVAEAYAWQNKLLEDKIKLEEKLEALEKAKQRRMLLYSEGRFQYLQDADTISSARADYQETYRGIEQSQLQDLLGMISEEADSFFKEYFTQKTDPDTGEKYQISREKYANYPRALINHMMELLRAKGKGSVFENLSDEELYKIFGGAMKPGAAYEQLGFAMTAEEEAAEKRSEAKKQAQKELLEENVKAYGVDTDFGKKILESQSQVEAAYWTKLRDTKLNMIKEYQEAYGDEAASKYFGTDVSKMGTWATNRDLYKQAWENQSDAWRTTAGQFGTDEDGYIDQTNTKSWIKNHVNKITADLLAAEYNATTALDFEGLGNQRLYNDIFSEAITKSEIQDLYDKAQYDITKGYLLNLASELKNNGIQGYARGTKYAQRGLSLVGENGPELRVLSRGDGVLPSSITENLWKWGSMTPDGILASLKQRVQGRTQTININNVTLPNVRDAQSFVTGLRELAQQYITRRS